MKFFLFDKICQIMLKLKSGYPLSVIRYPLSVIRYPLSVK